MARLFGRVVQDAGFKRQSARVLVKREVKEAPDHRSAAPSHLGGGAKYTSTEKLAFDENAGTYMKSHLRAADHDINIETKEYIHQNTKSLRLLHEPPRLCRRNFVGRHKGRCTRVLVQARQLSCYKRQATQPDLKPCARGIACRSVCRAVSFA